MASAQRNIGIATSNYSSSNSLYLNPALIADHREKLTIDVGSLNISFDNNLATVNTRTVYGNAFHGDTSNINKLFNFNSSDQLSSVGPYVEARMPGFIWHIARHNTLAVTTRMRVFAGFNNFNVDLFRTFFDDKFTSSGADYTALLHQFNVTIHAWSEIGLTYATTLTETPFHKVNFGITVRHLNGIGFAGLLGSELNTQYDAETQQFKASGDLKLASNLLDSKKTPGGTLSDLFFSNMSGTGMSADIGFTYEYMANGRRSTGYTFRASVAVTDLGFITYTNDNTIQLKTKAVIDVNALHNNGNSAEAIKAYIQKHGFETDSLVSADKVYLPRAIVAGFDYNIGAGFYGNLTGLINIADRRVFGNSYYTQFTLTPRYDVKHFTASIPISYSLLSKRLQLGLGLRLDHFFVGSDDMLLFFASGQTGFNIYMGGSIQPSRIRIKWLMSKKRKSRCYNCNTLLNWGAY